MYYLFKINGINQLEKSMFNTLFYNDLMLTA